MMQKSMGEQVVWLRKLSEAEVMMDMLSHNEDLLVHYELSISACEAVQPSVVQQALTHLYRKSPNLRVCIGKRENGESWFREMNGENIDFKVMVDSSVEEVRWSIFSHPYNSSQGPLWCARLLPIPQPRYSPVRHASFHQDLRHAFPHCYNVHFGFSHAIGDGHSYIKICQTFVTLLDDVLKGKAIDDAIQIASFDLNGEFERRFEACMAKMVTDEVSREACVREGQNGMPQASVVDYILSPPQGRDKKTLMYNQSLEEDATSRLMKQCKAAGISVNSCTSAICNLALVDLLVEKGVKQDTYTISNAHLMNLRRLWDPSTAASNVGCYIGTSNRQFIQTPPHSDASQFWEYAKHVHDKFYSYLNDERFLEKVAFIIWCYKNGKFEYVASDLTFNTRGNLTQRFAGTEKVQVCNLLSSTSIHNTNIPWDHIFGTIRGRLTHTLKYNTAFVSDEVAARYCDLIYARLMELVA